MASGDRVLLSPSVIIIIMQSFIYVLYQFSFSGLLAHTTKT